MNRNWQEVGVFSTLALARNRFFSTLAKARNVRFRVSSPFYLAVREKKHIFAGQSERKVMNRNQLVLDQIKTLASEVAPKGSQVLLFGSRARGDAHDGSDWDILIILPKDVLMQSDYDEVSYPLVELGWRLDERINPIMFTKQEWERNRITLFYDNVQHDSIPLVA